MEKVIGDKENEQQVRNRIAAERDMLIWQGREVRNAQNLFKEINPGLSDDFVEYYFGQRAQDNTVFATAGDKVQSMLCLTPYAVAMRKKINKKNLKRPLCMTDIVRVDTNLISMAYTKEGGRGKGYMKKLISGALEYQYRLKVPFCLVNADLVNSEFFEHFGFHYIYDRLQYVINETVISSEMLERAERGEDVGLNISNAVLKAADDSSLLSLAHFVNARLCRKYGLFVIRSAVYYERLQKELQSTGGNLFMIMEDDRITGYFAYTGDKADVLREIVFENDTDRELYFYQKEDKKPASMARIVNLPEMLKHIYGNGKVALAIRLTDTVIEENNGIFIWYIDEQGSRMECVAKSEDIEERPEITTTIGEFTAFIFEYMTLKRNAKFDNIYLAGSAWLNERY